MVSHYGAHMALHYLAESAFDDLLTAWRAHDALRVSSRASVQQLGTSRMALEGARDRMHRLRSALYPNPDELQAVLATALCPTLDEIVYLNVGHRDAQRPGNARCPCGELVPLTH